MKRKTWDLVYDMNPKAGRMDPITFVFPADFILVTDTREQDPFFAKHPPKGLVQVRNTLKYGDYSCRGFEDVIAIERKSFNDLLGSIGRERDRFERELSELAKYEYKALVIEGSMTDTYRWPERGRLTPSQIRGSLAAIDVRYCPVIWGERQWLEVWVLDRLIKFYKIKRKG